MDALSESPVAIVTGSGAQRIGAVLVEALAVRGYRVVVHFHRSINEGQARVADLQTRGYQALGCQADLSHDVQVKQLFETVRKHYGRLDVLVNTASIWRPTPLEAVTSTELRAQWEANVLSTFLCCQQAGLWMVDQPTGGCIINFGDWAQVRPELGYAAYFAAKGAIPTLTRSLAVELGQRNPRVRVNCILPGPMTPPEKLTELDVQRYQVAGLVGRCGQPEDLISAVEFLIHNTFVTGIELPVEGGRGVHAMAQRML